MNWKEIWVEKWRPQTIDDIILSDELRSFLVTLKKDSKDTGAIPNLLFSGPAGCGKSSLAKIIAKTALDCQYLYINASEETSIEVVRTKITGFAQTKSFDGKVKLIILDEADGLSNSNAVGRSSAQQALKNVIEEYSDNTRFIFITNHPDKIIEAIHSRLLHFTFQLGEKDCMRQAIKILKAEGVSIPKEQVEPFKRLIKRQSPDLRKILNQLQQASANGVLDLTSFVNQTQFYEYVLNSLINGADLMKLRQSVIENEDKLNIDYHDLMVGMFNCLLKGYETLEKKVKIQMSLILSDAIIDHFTVSDKEINFSACLFRLSQIIG